MFEQFTFVHSPQNNDLQNVIATLGLKYNTPLVQKICSGNFLQERKANFAWVGGLSKIYLTDSTEAGDVSKFLVRNLSERNI